MKTLSAGGMVLAFAAGAIWAASIAAIAKPAQRAWHGNSVVQVREVTPGTSTAATGTSGTETSQPSKKRTYHKTRVSNHHARVPVRRSAGARRTYRLRYFTGEVTNVGYNSRRIRAGSREYLLQDISDARITSGGRRGQSSDIRVGDRIEVSAVRIRRGVYDARTVRDLGPYQIAQASREPSEAVFPERFSVVGVITGIDSGTRTFTVGTIGGREYTVDATKASILYRSRTSTFGNLEVGDKVRVRGSLSDSRISARVVNEIAYGYVGQQTTLIGRFSSSNPEKRILTVSRANQLITVEVPVTVDVRMYDQEISLSSIPGGSTIKVKGWWVDSSTVEATYLEVFP